MRFYLLKLKEETCFLEFPTIRPSNIHRVATDNKLPMEDFQLKSIDRRMQLGLANNRVKGCQPLPKILIDRDESSTWSVKTLRGETACDRCNYASN